MQFQGDAASENPRFLKIEKSISWLRWLLAVSVLLNAALTVVFLLIGGINIFSRKIATRDILLEDGHGKVLGELGVKKDWDDFSTGKYYPGMRFYDESGKPAMTTFGTGSSYAYGDERASIGFTGIMINDKKGRQIMINPSMFSLGTENSIFMISPTEKGMDLSVSANGNEFGALVDDKSASMYVADPKAEVDINAEGSRPEINRILKNQNYVQPVR